jgi:hypothetical protein
MFTKVAGSLCLLALAVAPSIALADSTLAPRALESNQDFTLFNETGFTIGEVHISLANDDKWGGDVLGRDVLPSGEHARINFHGYKPSDCVFDMKIRRGNEGDSFVVEDVNLCELDEIAFTSKGDKVFFHKH